MTIDIGNSCNEKDTESESNNCKSETSNNFKEVNAKTRPRREAKDPKNS